MHLYVKPPDGRVLVSAPLRMNRAAIESFVRSKAGWIREKTAKFEGTAPPQGYVTGETLYVWGKPHILQVENGVKNSVAFADGKVNLTVRPGSTAEQRGRIIREWYRSLLKTEISKRLPLWEGKTGLHASGWQTKYMTTRWGTCNTATGKIWLNVTLAEKAPECLDYVLLHELVHLAEKNHGDAFKAMMDKYMPRWREIKVLLNGRIMR